jgi:hypothetical protein
MYINIHSINNDFKILIISYNFHIHIFDNTATVIFLQICHLIKSKNWFPCFIVKLTNCKLIYFHRGFNCRNTLKYEWSLVGHALRYSGIFFYLSQLIFEKVTVGWSYSENGTRWRPKAVFRDNGTDLLKTRYKYSTKQKSKYWDITESLEFPSFEFQRIIKKIFELTYGCKQFAKFVNNFVDKS